MELQTERCPWCDSEISRERFKEIEGRIRQEEQANFQAYKEQAEADAKAKADVEARKKITAAEAQRDAEIAKAKNAAIAVRDAEIAAARKAADQQLEKDREAAKKLVDAANTERDRAVAAQIASGESQATAIAAAKKLADEQLRKEKVAAQKLVEVAQAERDKALAEKNSSDEKMKGAIAAAKKEGMNEALKNQQDVLKQLATAEKARDEAIAAKNRSDAESQAAIEAARKGTLDQMKKEHDQDLKDQREVLEKESERSRNIAQAAHDREREAFQAQLREVQRKLDNKTANEIGDGAQINLFDELKDAFPEDRIDQIKKGVAGADIRHEVVHNGCVCGTIIYDSKARQQWRGEYVTKLREDQMADGADHAVLSSLVFPRGERDLCLQSGVIVISPARAVYIASILRQWLVQTHVLGLSKQQQESKIAQLYDFIVSKAFAELLTELMNLTDALFEVETAEVKAHENTWKKRGVLLAKQKRQLMSMRSQLSKIIEDPGAFDAVSPATEETEKAIAS